MKEKDIIRKHAIRNALIPVITLMGIGIGFIFGGSPNYRNSVFHTGDGKFAGIRHWQQGYSGSAGLRIHYGGSHLYGKYGC